MIQTYHYRSEFRCNHLKKTSAGSKKVFPATIYLLEISDTVDI